MSEDKLSLVADIGGTHARFALVPSNSTSTQHEHTLRCEDFPGPVEAARHYLSMVGNPFIDSAAFDVATAVTGDQIALTNGPWTFSLSSVENMAVGALLSPPSSMVTTLSVRPVAARPPWSPSTR